MRSGRTDTTSVFLLKYKKCIFSKTLFRPKRLNSSISSKAFFVCQYVVASGNFINVWSFAIGETHVVQSISEMQ